MDGVIRNGPSPSPESLALLAGSLAHMARYLRQNCPRAAERSALLLDRLEDGASLPAELLDACRDLQEALWPPGSPAAGPVTAAAAPSCTSDPAG